MYFMPNLQSPVRISLLFCLKLKTKRKKEKLLSFYQRPYFLRLGLRLLSELSEPIKKD